MSIYTSLSKFVANVITNNTVGVPVFLTTLSKSIWFALNFTNPIELGNSDFYNDPSSRKDVVFNPSDGKWYEKNGIFPNDQIFDTPLPQDIQDDLNNTKARLKEFIDNNPFIPGDI